MEVSIPRRNKPSFSSPAKAITAADFQHHRERVLSAVSTPFVGSDCSSGRGDATATTTTTTATTTRKANIQTSRSSSSKGKFSRESFTGESTSTTGTTLPISPSIQIRDTTNFSTNTTTTSSSNSSIRHSENEQRRSSNGTSSSLHSPTTTATTTTTTNQSQNTTIPERRITAGTTESMGSSSSKSSCGSGFRRLKKYSPKFHHHPHHQQLPASSFRSGGCSSNAAEAATTTTNTTTTTTTTMKKEKNKKSKDFLVDEFQQTQLRLWKAAQERNGKIQCEAQQDQKKRLRKDQKKKESKLLSLSVNSTRDDNDNYDWSSSNKQKKVKTKKQKMEQSTTEQVCSESPTVFAMSSRGGEEWESMTVQHKKKKKKKRRLIKMTSTTASLNATTNAVDDSIVVEDGIGCPKKKNTGVTGNSSTNKEVTNSSLDPPLNLSLALADTVKTRVRSCNKKIKDELELLQAASFEKKKRKRHNIKKSKNNKASVTKAAVATNGGSGSSRSHKKKKNTLMNNSKKKRSSFKFEQIFDSDSDDDDLEKMNEELVENRKRNGPVKSKIKTVSTMTTTDAEPAYDADGEVAGAVVLKSERGRPSKKKYHASEHSVPDDAPLSETSSSGTTVAAGVVKKKKKDQRIIVESSSSPEASHQEHHTLPWKKRMAAAAAADVTSSSWDKLANSSAAASKISFSSAGNNAGATPEMSTEASSISEFTHPFGSMPAPSISTSKVFTRPSTSVPREILSNLADTSSSRASSFDMNTSFINNTSATNINNSSTFMVSATMSDSDSDTSTESDTDEEELFKFANRMFGTCAKPVPKDEKKSMQSLDTSGLTPELCEMERRRQKQEEARSLTAKEINAILKEDAINSGGDEAGSWVRRSIRQPSRSLLNAPLTKTLLNKLRGNDSEVVVLKMKKYISDPDAPATVIDAVLDALEECTICESLYIQVSGRVCLIIVLILL